MKVANIVVGISIASTALLSAYAQAQSDSRGLSRTEVKQELRALQIAGYDPTATINYSQSLAAAEDKVSNLRNASATGPNFLAAQGAEGTLRN